MKAPEKLEGHYAGLERSVTIRSAPDYARLVVPNGNAAEPVHRWFHMKEAYSCNLLLRLLKDLDLGAKPGLRILDPFCGVGTTLVSTAAAAAGGDLQAPVVYGIETNPFLHLAASTKLAALLSPEPGLLDFARAVAAAAYRDRNDYPVPALSTFHNPRFFDAGTVQQLLRLRAAVDARADAGAAPSLRTLGYLAVGASVEPSSCLRKDGRALRFVERQPASPIDLFLDRSTTISEDMPLRRLPLRGAAYHGDGVTMRAIDSRFDAFDLVVCSPPYPNNIDYTEVYKLENWLLGYLDSDRAFASQRAASVHSHPSIKRPHPLQTADLSADVREGLLAVTDPIVSCLPEDRYRRARAEVIEGYVLDMYRTAEAARQRLRPGGTLVVVVGNSVHGTGDQAHVIAADLLIAQVAGLAGLTVEHVSVARQLERRGSASHFLRESLIFATKGDE